jgi:hypothetical protein
MLGGRCGFVDGCTCVCHRPDVNFSIAPASRSQSMDGPFLPFCICSSVLFTNIVSARQHYLSLLTLLHLNLVRLPLTVPIGAMPKTPNGKVAGAVTHRSDTNSKSSHSHSSRSQVTVSAAFHYTWSRHGQDQREGMRQRQPWAGTCARRQCTAQ